MWASTFFSRLGPAWKNVTSLSVCAIRSRSSTWSRSRMTSVPPETSGAISSNMLMLKLKRAIAGITSRASNA